MKKKKILFFANSIYWKYFATETCFHFEFLALKKWFNNTHNLKRFFRTYISGFDGKEFKKKILIKILIYPLFGNGHKMAAV
jgi:hypothetical protein